MFRFFFFGLRINLSVDSVFFYSLLFFSFLSFFLFLFPTIRAAKTRAPIFYTVRFNRYAIMVIVASFRFAGRTIYPPVLFSIFFFFSIQFSPRCFPYPLVRVQCIFFFFYYYFSDVRWTISGQSSLIFVKKKKKRYTVRRISHFIFYRPILRKILNAL